MKTIEVKVLYHSDIGKIESRKKTILFSNIVSVEESYTQIGKTDIDVIGTTGKGFLTIDYDYEKFKFLWEKELKKQENEKKYGEGF